ncbi:MAG: rRNA maturation RNase YbeY [Burkholderiales bacterium]|nr:rRNA maturation RNase YbeY [Burkholderiales bacterium]
MPSPACELDIQIVSRLPGIPKPAAFRRWATLALDAAQKRARPATVTLRIVNAVEGRGLNSAFRGKDYATNVLTFIYHEPRAPRLMGDVVLCAPVVAAEARLQGKRLADHYAHLTLHGLLHLAGHDHETAREAARMEAIETRLLADLGIADPYA